MEESQKSTIVEDILKKLQHENDVHRIATAHDMTFETTLKELRSILIQNMLEEQ
jgi:hypothetical protein